MNADVLKLLLRSYIINFPILATWKRILYCPVALIFDNFSQAGDFVKEISPAPIMIDAGMKVKRMQELLAEINSRGAFLFLTNCKKISQKEHEKIRTFCDIAVTQKYSGSPVIGAMVIICNRRVPEEVLDIAVAFQVNESQTVTKYELLDLIPSPLQLELVKDRIEGLMDFEDDVVNVFCSAAMFMYPRLREKKDGLADHLEDHTQQVLKESRLFGDEEDILEMSVQRFFECAGNGNFENCYTLPNLEEEAIQKLKTAVYVKPGILYLHPEKFKEIMQPLLQIFNLTVIKRTLFEAEMLMADAGGYTKKMSYFSVYGNAERVRMMAFDTEKMCQADGAKLRYFLED